jgi:ankyrin repeat protein
MPLLHLPNELLQSIAEELCEAVVKLLIATDGVDPNCKDLFERTPQSLAARKGHKTDVKLLQIHALPGQNTPKHYIDADHPTNY